MTMSQQGRGVRGALGAAAVLGVLGLAVCATQDALAEPLRLAAVAPRAGGVPSEPASNACREAAHRVEARLGLPPNLLIAISRTETGKRLRSGASLGAWPWTLHAAGESHYYATQAEAVVATHRLKAEGRRSIDVGCMQINLMHHPEAFPTLEAAFDPVTNMSYAAAFLLELKERYGTWEQAVARYHSADPARYRVYEARVAKIMAEELSTATACTRAPVDALGPDAAVGGCPRRPTLLTDLSERPAEASALTSTERTPAEAPRLRLVAFGAYDWL